LRKAAAPVLPENRHIHHRHAVAPGVSPARVARNWLPPEPSVQIAIPAEALLPPGAAPDGIGFIADMRILTDGSMQQVGWQPQLVGFERSRP